MMNLKNWILSVINLTLLTLILPAYAGEPPTRAILLNAVQGDKPQKVSMRVTQGQAKGCILEANAFLNKQRLRYEYDLSSSQCVKDGQVIPVGRVVRGQHNIKGTMANSGMGRDYLISNKGVNVTLDYQ
ncbi:hypothetical protein [Thiomicrorhabdus sp.]|uniref:hypothetical protein n=1 Tax=Thiomicrorhabdus sp. TaxID=2039724 RepID=UPI003564A6F8